MNTDDLLTALAADAAPGPGLGRRLALWLLPSLPLAGAVMLALLLALLGVRADLGSALGSAVVLKTLLPLAFGLLALRSALRWARPVVRGGAAGLGLLGLFAAGLFGVTLLRMPAAGWLEAATGPSIPVCVTAIAALAVVPLAVMLVALRSGASVDPARCGLWAGLAAGGFAATVYSLHCTEDGALFYLTWYALGIATAGALGRAAGGHWLRW